jgi:hypothetical protein
LSCKPFHGDPACDWSALLATVVLKIEGGHSWRAQENCSGTPARLSLQK